MRSDTLHSSLVLIGYMVGLLPFGLSKIFSLWHMSKLNQAKVAKYSAISLGFNIFFSLIFIYPLQAFGLALASSLSGFILFWLNYQEYKKDKNLGLFTNKKIVFYLVAIGVFTLFSVILEHYLAYLL